MPKAGWSSGYPNLPREFWALQYVEIPGLGFRQKGGIQSLVALERPHNWSKLVDGLVVTTKYFLSKDEAKGFALANLGGNEQCGGSGR